ncbi:hypothetical protein EDB84DRAFT_434001 [Lactarius hengduanensis]|nr:hypothetical protein EDB84DRAFT_434001 [Lactarius hengduanensis]
MDGRALPASRRLCGCAQNYDMYIRRIHPIFMCFPLGDSLGVLGANSPMAPDPLSTLTPLLVTHLLDAYCVAFALPLGPHFAKVAPVELSADRVDPLRYPQRGNRRIRARGPLLRLRRRAEHRHTALVVVPHCKGCDAFAWHLLVFRAQTIVLERARAGYVGKVMSWLAKENAVTATEKYIWGIRYISTENTRRV